jgi:two-component system cell cycle response regulator
MRVVLVDPSRTMRMFVTRLLAVRGYEVEPFADGPQALDYLRADPDACALITSGELGAMTGLELCWEARLVANAGRPLYVIVMSSSVDKHRLGEALDAGADDFIGKPPVAEELYARLRAAERMGAMQRELVRLASIDPLTSVYNRRAFFEAAQALVQRPGRLCAVMLDIDHFKRINDVYGHDVGDEAIATVAREAAAAGAVTGRLGGEEFALLLDELSLADAVAAAEKLRGAVAALAFDTAKGPLTLTCSFGVSEWQAGDSIDQLLKRADVALYAAKTGGRNRVVATDSVVAPYDRRALIRAVAR